MKSYSVCILHEGHFECSSFRFLPPSLCHSIDVPYGLFLSCQVWKNIKWFWRGPTAWWCLCADCHRDRWGEDGRCANRWSRPRQLACPRLPIGELYIREPPPELAESCQAWKFNRVWSLHISVHTYIYIIFELISISIYLYVYIHIYIQFCFYVQTHVNLSTKPCDFGFCFALGFFKGTSEGMQSV